MSDQKKQYGLRLWLGRASFGFVILLTLVLVFLDWRGGRSWWSSLPLFFPSQCWLAPLVVLFPAALLLNRRLCWLLLVPVILVCFVYMRFHCSMGRTAHPADITLLSNNIADRDLAGLWSFIESCNPDVLALQEAKYWAQTIRKRFNNRHISINGEFALVSRFPIISATPVVGMNRGGFPLAVRYKLLRDGRSFVVYNIHMPTPRSYFLALRDGVLSDPLLPQAQIATRQSWRSYADYWSQRIELTRLLVAAMDREQEPFVLAGDFNMPDHGTMYREFKSRCADSFASAGCGYGLTFPGNSDTIVSLHRPWLRIDYQFAGTGIRPITCEVEPWKRAKHLAVFGQYELQPECDSLISFKSFH